MDRLTDEPAIDEVRVLERVDGGVLVRTRWTPHSDIVEGVKTLDATIISATGSSTGWHFTIRTRNREAFTRFQSLFRSRGTPIEVARVYELDGLVEGADVLTSAQREVLSIAREGGYFESPRKTSLQSIADQMEISPRAVSGRLRRGVRNLIDEVVCQQEVNGVAGDRVRHIDLASDLPNRERTIPMIGQNREDVSGRLEFEYLPTGNGILERNRHPGVLGVEAVSFRSFSRSMWILRIRLSLL